MNDTVKAYHGTTSDNAASILRSEFRLSMGSAYFLGDGVYFFEENSYGEGLNSAKKWVRNNCSGLGVVLEAEITFGNVLDYSSNEHLSKLKNFRDKILNNADIDEETKSKLKGQDSEGALLNMFCPKHNIDVIRAVKNKNPNLGFSSRFVNSTETYLCVRNIDNISNVTQIPWQNLRT